MSSSVSSVHPVAYALNKTTAPRETHRRRTPHLTALGHARQLAASGRYGSGCAWQELAGGAETGPVEAADLYRPRLESDLHHPNIKLYPGIAATLATTAELRRGDRSADFASFIAQIRQDYGRRPSLMKALDAKGL
jgi:hypothetical protein